MGENGKLHAVSKKIAYICLSVYHPLSLHPSPTANHSKQMPVVSFTTSWYCGMGTSRMISSCSTWGTSTKVSWTKEMGISSTFSTLEHSMGVRFSQERWQLELDILRSAWRIDDWMGGWEILQLCAGLLSECPYMARRCKALKVIKIGESLYCWLILLTLHVFFFFFILFPISVGCCYSKSPARLPLPHAALQQPFPPLPQWPSHEGWCDTPTSAWATPWM